MLKYTIAALFATSQAVQLEAGAEKKIQACWDREEPHCGYYGGEYGCSLGTVTTCSWVDVQIDEPKVTEKDVVEVVEEVVDTTSEEYLRSKARKIAKDYSLEELQEMFPNSWKDYI